MASTEQILEAATRLGKMVAEHEAAVKFEDTINKIRDDTEAQRILNDYNRHAQTIQEKQSTGKPIEVEDKRKLESLQQAVIANQLLRDFQMVQMDYLDLMRRVDEAIQGGSPQTASPPPAAESPIVNPEV